MPKPISQRTVSQIRARVKVSRSPALTLTPRGAEDLCTVGDSETRTCLLWPNSRHKARKRFRDPATHSLQHRPSRAGQAHTETRHPTGHAHKEASLRGQRAMEGVRGSWRADGGQREPLEHQAFGGITDGSGRPTRKNRTV